MQVDGFQPYTLPNAPLALVGMAEKGYATLQVSTLRTAHAYVLQACVQGHANLRRQLCLRFLQPRTPTRSHTCKLAAMHPCSQMQAAV